MGVWINVGHAPVDGKPWKHGDPHCPKLQERDRAGFPIRKVKNVDHNKPLDQHVRRRCDSPGCFGPRDQLRGLDLREPSWLRRAHAMELLKPPGSYWVYLLSDPTRQLFQVGKAANLYERLRSRFRATIRGGFHRPDGIPWLHDRLVDDLAYEPSFEALNYPTELEALEGERTLRHELREAGWYDSSDR